MKSYVLLQCQVDALLHALEKQREIDPTIKCLVVSQFTSFLRLLRQPLEGRGFKFVCLDGSLSQEKRAAAMREFADCRQGSPTIFLLSLKAGGVGLNLTAASRLFLMDPVSSRSIKSYTSFIPCGFCCMRFLSLCTDKFYCRIFCI